MNIKKQLLLAVFTTATIYPTHMADVCATMEHAHHQQHAVSIVHPQPQLLADQRAQVVQRPWYDVRRLFEQQPSHILEPKTIRALQEIIHKARIENKKIALVGAGKSQGGQTMSWEKDSFRVSLHKLNRLLTLDLQAKEVTVQAGMTWKQLQEIIAPHNLSVKAMQSYNDFSIGGSLGVNVHGQDLQANPLIKTVKSFKLLLASGEHLTVSRQENADLFGLAIGGYGLCGIITQVTLKLCKNSLLQPEWKTIKTNNLADYMVEISSNPDVEFMSARLSLDPDHLLEDALVIQYKKAKRIRNRQALLQALSVKADKWKTDASNFVLRRLLWLSGKLTFLKRYRLSLDTKLLGTNITSRNNFMGSSIESLPYNSQDTDYILQEYFIPYKHLNTFLAQLRLIMQEHKINLLNITARHVNEDTESLLSFSPRDTCALVLYLPQTKGTPEYENTVVWTGKLIDAARYCGGRFYLPYHLIATPEQLHATYPEFDEFIHKKFRYDPSGIFSNQFWEKYGERSA